MRKISCMLITLMAALALLVSPHAAGARTSAEQQALRVMTYNIRYNTPADGGNAWPHRKDMVASMIRFHRPDLVGLQEALRGQNTDLAQRLSNYEWFGVGRADGQTEGEYNSIFYRDDRLELLDHDTFWLSENPEEPGSMGWDAACPRIVTWARFRDRVTGGVFYHFNTHFDHRGQQARRESARLLRSRIGDIAADVPAVVTGDFNCTEKSRPYRVLVEAGEEARLHDTVKCTGQPHHGPKATYSGFDPADAPSRRIDYVFVTNRWQVIRHGTLSDRWNGRYPSDHLPVLAETVLPRRTAENEAMK